MCSCTFIVIMQHGPVAGCFVNKTIESLCLVQSYACLDPNLQLFLKMVKEKLQNEPCVLENKKSATSFTKWLNQASYCICDISWLPCLSISFLQNTKCAKQSPCKKRPPDGLSLNLFCYRNSFRIEQCANFNYLDSAWVFLLILLPLQLLIVILTMQLLFVFHSSL